MGSLEYIEYLLENYHEIKSEIEMLKFELECFCGITPDETIEALSYKQEQGERIQTSNISDKTGKIASIYKQVAERLNVQSICEIQKRIVINELEIARLEFCIKKLRGPMGDIICDLYIKLVNVSEICQKQYLSEKTINRYRKKGIQEIASLMDKRRLAI